MQQKQKDIKNAQGNALFLILIAVALFAALSYAITQSSRGGGNITKEKNMIVAARLSQTGAIAASTVQRMIILGTDPDDIDMDNTGMFGFLDTCKSGVNCVYVPEGGGLTEPQPSVDDGIAAYIYGNDGTGAGSISGVGTAAADIYLAAILTNIDLCKAINHGLGLGDTIHKELTVGNVIADGLPIAGQPYFCYDSSVDPATTSYFYVHLLHQR